MDGGVTKERVLIVDDEPQILVALEDLLSDDFTVLKSQTPENALAQVEQDPNIAVVITDQRMPRMTGDELLSRMSSQTAVGIMVSGFSDLPAVIRAINEGKVFAYVTKPWNPQDLRFKVAKGVEHFRLARQVAHERQLLADLMNGSTDGIFFKDKDLKFQRVNQAFSVVLGALSPEQLIGRKLSDGLLPGDNASAIETEERNLLGGGAPVVDVVREYRAGSNEWYSESKAPIRGPDGVVDGLVAISRNVTERLRTQDALRKSEDRLRQQTRILNSILDGIGEGVIVVDSSGRTLLFNSEAQRVLGTQARDVPPEQWARAYGVYLADGRTLVPAAENPLVRAMHGARKVEMEVIIKNGASSEARVAIVATPLRNDSAEVTGAIALLRDVTQKRSLEQLLVHSQKMEAVGQLAGGVAHDFNNLLAVIEGSGEMALEELVGHVAREDVLDMVTAAKRAASLTRQLLAFSRREAARPEPIQLANVVRSVEKMLRRLIGEHITLLARLEEVSPIMADSNQLEQVLINLCVNARDAMPEGGTLCIELRPVAPGDPNSLPGLDAVRLSVTDTGTGMDSEVLKRIFEPFFTTKEIGKGTGLGLSMVYGIVTQNGGQISVESSVGRGSTFTIVFPVTSLDQTHAHSSMPPRAGAPPSGTILLVEDDPSVRHITARILRRHGYIVVEASKPSEARAISEVGDDIDLLLTDLVMPEMTGVKLADELTLARPGLRVLYMTGYAGAALNQAQGELLNPEDGVIQKPFTSDALLDRVRAALLSPATAEEN
jgi:two-component system, cell cycle sensor histidine kinase and response regulator CckA